MLEEQLREIKSGHRISYEAIKYKAHREKAVSYQPQLFIQRLQSFERGSITPWEALGYITGVRKGLVFHPVATYRLFTSK